MIVVGLFQVAEGGAQRLQDDRRLLGRQQAPERELEVARPVPAELPPRPDQLVLLTRHPPVRLGEPLKLPGSHRQGHLQQVGLCLRGNDPGQRPHLGVRQSPGGELRRNEREAAQRPRHPDLVSGRARGDLAPPRKPGRAGGHVPVGPSLPGVEIGDQQQEPAGGRGKVPGQLADPRLQPLHRLRHRLVRVR
jgi:hypothetical protein